ncbi:MAG: alpha-galactosidase [Clostridia bacterium]|nr:alpha-galactosidase [Clostridia bacterium]
MTYDIYGEDGARLSLEEINDGAITYLKVKMQYSEPCEPKPFHVEWMEPVTDTYSFWGPNVGTVRHLAPDWSPRNSDARIASGAPVHAVISADDTNKTTIALSDPKIPTNISTGIDEKAAAMKYRVSFFIKPAAPLTDYSATVRIDRRRINYCDAVRGAVSWWEKDCGYIPASVPESARLPMNSLWYSFHQDLDFDKILEQCRLSKPLGMDTVIIDDGWQTTDTNGGYAYCGDWKPIGLPRIAELVGEIHKIGMKVILWFSVPFLGKYSESFEEFKDYTLYSYNNDTIYALDPRYKKVRDYLIGIYSAAAREWKLDGLKLDFIDSFCLGNDEGKPTWERDYTSLEDAVDVLMTDAAKALLEINPEMMIEFRQSYIGPAIRKYGNMLRVGDCPCDALSNRRAIIDLRLISGKTAVHSDMLMWNVEDWAENVALQLASILFAVPQISVHLDKITKGQMKALSHYLSFWREKRHILLDGEFYAACPATTYSYAYAHRTGEAVYVLYENPVIASGWNKLSCVNCGCGEFIYLDGYVGKTYRTVNCMGEELSSGIVSSDVEKIPVPVGGMVFIK